MLQLAANIKLIRELSGQTQPIFGKKFEASKAMIISYERAKAKPSNLFIKRLSEASGVPEADLLDTDLKESDIDVEKIKKVFHVKSDRNAFVSTNGAHSDVNLLKKYVASIERENARLQKDLDLSLGELRHNILLGRSIAETSQDFLIEVLAKQRNSTVEAVSVEVGKANAERYQKLKEEGNFPDAGK